MPDQPILSSELRTALGLAVETSRRYGHEYITLEHVLYALLHEPDSREVVEACGGDIDELVTSLKEYFETSLDTVPGNADFVIPEETLALRRVIERATSHVLSCEKNLLEGVDVLVALFSEPESHATYFLVNQGITRMDVVAYVSHGPPAGRRAPTDDEDAADFLDFDADDEFDDDPDEGSDNRGGLEAGSRRSGKERKSPLELYAANLTQMARNGEIDPVIGRKDELRRLMRTLCRRRKNNPMLVGEPGVGKTALVEGLALRVIEDRVPEHLQGAEIFALDMGALLAGTRYRGDFEERLKQVVDQVIRHKCAILFIDEFHTVVGAGATQGGSMDASNILKPVLAGGKLRCIGSTTYQEYKNHILKDRALSRRFQKIDVPEPSVEDTIKILHGLRPFYEEHYGIVFAPSALETAARLSARYMNDRFLPDKAIDIIDEAGAAHEMLPPSAKKKSITVRDVEAIVSDVANIPAAKISNSDLGRLESLETDLKARVFGQDEAVHRVARAVKLGRAGIRDQDKPVGSFLFTGPTGVGKTELSKQLAEVLGIHFMRFDMSEYQERHTISRLVGAPPGYVGFEQGGLLTEAVIRNPYSVLLLDEIEKAHSDIYNVLLQVMDYGTLTDNNGRKADFRNVIVIMTSNVGARELARDPLGFAPPSSRPTSNPQAVERAFSPEFRNRLDAIIHFQPLDQPLIVRVVDKFIDEMRDRLKTRGVLVAITPAARKWIADTGYDAHYGARPIAKLIQERIHEKLVDEILFGALAKGGYAHIDAVDGDLVITTDATTMPGDTPAVADADA